MSYLDERFPDSVAAGGQGGPGYSTTVVAVQSGAEQRNQNWTRARHTYEMSQGIKDAADFKAIAAHFRMARGKLHHFRVKDHADYSLARTESSLVLITSTTFQLHKLYGEVSGFEDSRKITRPVSGSVQIWKDAALQTLTTHYTVAHETGIVTFTSPPGGATLEAACEFDVPMRYDTDQLDARLVHRYQDGSALMQWETVPLVEVRE